MGGAVENVLPGGEGHDPSEDVPREASSSAPGQLEGVPDDFSKMKRMVVPDALQVLVSKTYRKTTVLGTLASEVGWKHGDLIKKLEAARIAKNAEFYAAKKAD